MEKHANITPPLSADFPEAEVPAASSPVRSMDSQCRLVRFFTSPQQAGTVTMQAISPSGREEVTFSAKALDALTSRKQLHQQIGRAHV